jgi:hypothetical protein
MRDRTVTTLKKALTYVDREPYRSMIRSRLAGLRYGTAVTDLRLNRTHAVQELRASRELDRTRITSLHYAIGLAALAIPGARRIIKSTAMRVARERIARALDIIR